METKWTLSFSTSIGAVLWFVVQTPLWINTHYVGAKWHHALSGNSSTPTQSAPFCVQIPITSGIHQLAVNGEWNICRGFINLLRLADLLILNMYSSIFFSLMQINVRHKTHVVNAINIRVRNHKMCNISTGMEKLFKTQVVRLGALHDTSLLSFNIYIYIVYPFSINAYLYWLVLNIYTLVYKIRNIVNLRFLSWPTNINFQWLCHSVVIIK